MVQRMIRAAARRVGEGDPEDLVDLVDLRAVLDIAIHDAVQAQRAAGITWRAIGEATGTSHVAAIQKWGRS
jgi:hypothetical protein